MLSVWQAPVSRPTRDIDLLGYTDNGPERLAAIVREICAMEAAEDGLLFDARSVHAEAILEGANYAGVRVKLLAYLGRARVPIQIDVSFGDALVPGPAAIRLPALLDLERAELQGYSPESMIAEKMQAMVVLGELNSRMKDFYDLWLLARRQPFDAPILAEAVRATFLRRGTPLSAESILFRQGFPGPRQQEYWLAFMRRNDLDQPASLDEAVGVIRSFLSPVLVSLSEGSRFSERWEPPGPWALVPAPGA
jgi:hypothetical protein